MKTLLIKVRRAMWSNKKVYLACIFLIACGILIYISLSIAVDGLERAKLSFYAEYRVADAYARVGAAPVNEVGRLRSVHGVQDVSHRTVREVRAEIDGNDENITLRLISYDPQEYGRINDIEIDGSIPSDITGIVLDNSFLNTNSLELGDRLQVFTGGQRFVFEITGTFRSPEYIFVEEDSRDFGIGFITVDSMTDITGLPGISNEIIFTLESGIRFDDIRPYLRDALQSFGLVSLIPKEDQISYSSLDMQVQSNRSIAVALPSVLIGMAALVLYLMMKRIIEQERTQIGTIKAFGFSNKEVVLHYLCYGAITGIVGGVVGWAGGAALSGVILNIYLEFFFLPGLAPTVDLIYLVIALAISISTGLLGAAMGALSVLRLNPVEAMRPEAPKPVKGKGIGKLKILKVFLTSMGIMSLRDISRHKMRSVFIIISVMFSFAILAVSGSLPSMITGILTDQFAKERLYNARITLREPVGYIGALESAYAIPYVTQADALLDTPVTLTNRHISENVILTGVPANSQLFKVRDSGQNTYHEPPEEGLILSHILARKLQAEAGDILLINVPYKTDDIPIPVTRVIEQNLGSNAYMEIGALSMLLSQPPSANAIIINTDNLPFVREHLRPSPDISRIEDTDATMRAYLEMMETDIVIFNIMFLMGIAMAYAMIYNTSTISLSERKREYTTLRVLGITINEICEIMRFEYWLLTLVGMALGIPASKTVMNMIGGMMDPDTYSLPTTIPLSGYLMAAGGCVVAVTLSNIAAKRKIKKLDMVEVLKERE